MPLQELMITSLHGYSYSDSDIDEYIIQAEKFYQLYTFRYGYQQVTPYMMKFIDVVPHLMKALPCTLGRFQSQGGEHANYQHARYYFQHTTRHGGANKSDPLAV